MIQNPNVWSPAEFEKFSTNGDNKERLFEIIEQVWLEKKHVLENRVIVFAQINDCIKMNQLKCSLLEELPSNYKEKDKKVLYLLQNALKWNENLWPLCFLCG